jgi:hypothetical protein
MFATDWASTSGSDSTPRRRSGCSGGSSALR